MIKLNRFNWKGNDMSQKRWGRTNMSMASTWKHFLFGGHCFPLFSTFTPKPLRPTPSTTYLMRSVTWFYTLIETSSFHYQQHNMLCQHKCVQSNITTLKSSTYTTDAWADMCGKLLAFFKRSQLMATVLISHDSKQRKWLNVCERVFRRRASAICV